jgi:hypothetical protein
MKSQRTSATIPRSYALAMRTRPFGVIWMEQNFVG